MLYSSILTPIEANDNTSLTKSHNYMLRTGMISQIASGLFAWLPLGKIITNNLINLINFHLDHSAELTMPNIQPINIWEKNNRIENYGKEMLCMEDRNNCKLIYAPTAEEIMTFTFGQNFFSYRSLPIRWHQITPKFRDEISPRNGVIRSREFLMQDGYSFDINSQSSLLSYELYFNAYIAIFNAMRLNYIIVPACSGNMGGKINHEFIYTTQNNLLHAMPTKDLTFKKYHNQYKNIATEFNNAYSVIENDDTNIEIAHTFHFEQKYTRALNIAVCNENNQNIYPYMGSYGIGVSRVIAMVVEQFYNTSTQTMHWPKCIAPFALCLLWISDSEYSYHDYIKTLYMKLKATISNILLDDRIKVNIKTKVQNALLLGAQHLLVITNKNNEYQIFRIEKDKRVLMNNTIEEIVIYYKKNI